MNWLKIILPIFALFVPLFPINAATVTYEGTCNPSLVTLKATGSFQSDILLDGQKVSEVPPSGNWELKLPIKPGDHTLSIANESQEFNIPKCSEGGIIYPPCSGLTGKFLQNKIANGECGKNVAEPTAEEKVVIQLLQQLVELYKQLIAFYSSR